MKKITTLVSCAIVAAATHALAVLPFSGTYLQDFQTLPTSTGAWTNNSTLPGWFSSATTINYRATSGSTSLTNSDLQSVNLGAGDLALVNVNDAVWLVLTNTSSITYSEAILTYDVIALRKRSGTQDRSLTLNFGVFDAGEGSVGAATNPVPTASVNLSPMAEGSTVQVNATIASISWAPGQELWLRWNFPNQANQHHVGGINNLTVIPEPSTYAAIFGLLVLGVVAYRRRR